MRIGIDLGGTKIEGIILDHSGVVLEKIRIATPGQEYQQILNAVTSVVTELQSRAASRLSVGIGTPGSLSLVSNTMKNCNSTCNRHFLSILISILLAFFTILERSRAR